MGRTFATKCADADPPDTYLAARPDWVTSSVPTWSAPTLPARPSGFPNATTNCPTRSDAASPNSTGAGTSPRARSTARSDNGSRPTTSVRTTVPSVNAASAPLAPATTCALVSNSRSSVITLALPEPLPRDVRTTRLATLGNTVSATEITVLE